MKNKKENGEDATKYGEFVSSFFTWITPKTQKNRTEELENMTKVNKGQNSKKNRENKR